MGMLWATLPIMVLDLFQVRCASCKDWENILHNSFLWPDRLTRKTQKKTQWAYVASPNESQHMRRPRSTHPLKGNWNGSTQPSSPQNSIKTYENAKFHNLLDKYRLPSLFCTISKTNHQSLGNSSNLLAKKASSFWCNPT